LTQALRRIKASPFRAARLRPKAFLPEQQPMVVGRFVQKLAAMIAAGALLVSSAAEACTGIRLIAADGTVVHARTLEFAVDLHSDVLVSPRGYERVGIAPDGKDGLKWKAKYASVGANGVGLPILIDGVNEAGLAAGLFYFPTTARYQSYAPDDAAKTIAPWQLGSWILDNFASVDEVKANIGSIVVAATVLKQCADSDEAARV
jgi:choloylglycine hydrolase